MQSDAAVTRSEANAADAAATSLSTSMNRKERLTAIEDEITQLKGQADSQAASAQQAAEDAASKRVSWRPCARRATRNAPSWKRRRRA